MIRLRRFAIGVVTAPIRFYRRYISGLKPAPTCRYLPTCSSYALEAIEKRGVFVGVAKTAWRICRCHPFSKGGYDPVTPPREHSLPGDQRSF